MARRGSRMTKQWITQDGAQSILTTNTTQSPAGINFSGGGTIIRSMGEYVISATPSPTALDSVFIGMGIIVMNEDTFTTGGTAALPDPIDDGEAPWLYRQVHPFFFAETAVGNASAAASVRKAFDVKSMRRVRGDQTIAMVIQYLDITGAPPVTVTVGSTRYLLAT